MKALLTTIVLLATLLLSTMSLAEDLMQIYQMAFANNPELLAESSSRQAADELVAQANAQFLPQISLNVNHGRTVQHNKRGRRDIRHNYNNHGYTLKLTQPVYRRENFIKRKQADIAVEISEANYQAVQHNLIVRVAEHYFDVLAKQDDLTFAAAERETIAKQLMQARQRFDVGLATITDVTESQAAYDSANAAVIGAENEFTNSRERLREISGRYLDTLSGLQSDTPLVSPEPEDIDKWSEVALSQNPALWAANMAVNHAHQSITLQKAGHYPTLDVVGQKNYTSSSHNSSTGSSQNHRDTLVLQLNMPIYSGGNVYSKTREAEHLLNRAMQAEEQRRREVQRQSREYYNSVMSDISRVKALKQAVISNEKALESTEAGYKVGTRTTVDVLNVRRDLFKARRNYAQSRYSYILNTLRLKQAAGTISVDDLNNINQWLVD